MVPNPSFGYKEVIQWLQLGYSLIVMIRYTIYYIWDEDTN